MLLKLFIIINILISIQQALCNKIQSRTKFESEKYLKDTLLKNYDKQLKPQDVTEIKFALNLNQIITLIETQQIIVLNAFLDHEWLDQRLKWDPNEFNNITLMRIPSEIIWS